MWSDNYFDCSNSQSYSGESRYAKLNEGHKPKSKCMRILGNADLHQGMQSRGAEYTGKKSLWKNSIGFGGDPPGVA